MTRLIASLLLALPAPSLHCAAPEASAAIARGKAVFATCATCHQPTADVPNPGPELRRIAGRRAGSYPGFRYSRAMKNAQRAWTDEALNEFLADPQAAVPGNNMPFPGLPDEQQRRDLIAFLKTLE